MDKRNGVFSGMDSVFVESWKVFCPYVAFSSKSGRTSEPEDICRLYRNKKRLFICLFLYAKSAFGIVVYFASLIPQFFLLAPLYLFLFYVTTENRQLKRGKITIFLMIVTFLTACLIEVKWNLPLMKKIL
jgi:hypothetical protein